MAKQRKPVVENCRFALDQMKMEVAAELGIAMGVAEAGSASHQAEFAGELGGVAAAQPSKRPYMGHYTSRETGSIGGRMTQRLIAAGEQFEL